MNEAEFWRCTPKKLQGLFHVHEAAKGGGDEQSIDDIIF